jgi:hypothetical protein
MNIKKTVQGESSKDDKVVFGQLGHWLLSKKVQKELGIAVSSEPGDIWHVATSSRDQAIGFALSRQLKTKKTIHLRFVYATSNKAVQALINGVIVLAIGSNQDTVYTNARETDSVWQDMGFVQQPHESGVFCRWEKTIEWSDKK